MSIKSKTNGIILTMSKDTTSSTSENLATAANAAVNAAIAAATASTAAAHAADNAATATAASNALATANAVTSNNISTMQGNISEIKEGMRIGLRDIKAEVTNLNTTIDGKYSTKEELKVVSDEVQALKNLKEWAIKIIVGAIIISLLALAGLKSK